VVATLLWPLQLAVLAAARRADWDQLTGVARVVGWTPFGAPWTAGFEVVEGRAWAAVVKLLITGVAVGALLFWWSRTLESAMVGAASAGPSRQRRGAAGGAVAQLFPRAVAWAGRDRFGALVARECRYWWRDARRRANLITVAVMSIFVPVMVNLGGSRLAVDGGQAFGSATANSSPLLVSLSMLFVGVLASATLANQFGLDGSAYAANVVAGVPGRLELRARMTAFSLYVVPMLGAVAVILSAALGRPGWLGMIVGGLGAAYGCGLAANAFVAVLGGYALPETSNPFAMNTGAGAVKGLLSLLSMVASSLAAMPVVLAAALLGDVWRWVALPVGLAYGAGAALLGSYLAGDVLDRRQPELLAIVTPRR
jgi:ABC-2 type transport system permease protein